MPTPLTFEQRKPLHHKAASIAHRAAENAERTLAADYPGEPEESREQYLIYAAEYLAKGLAALRKALDPKDFAEATEVLR